MSEINLQGYMSSAIRRIMAKAYRNVLTLGVKGALQSPLFKKLRAVHLVGGEHDVVGTDLIGDALELVQEFGVG